jgi:hypothetical protein
VSGFWVISIRTTAGTVWALLSNTRAARAKRNGLQHRLIAATTYVFAKPGATASSPDETFDMRFAKDNAAEEGFNRWTISQ